MDINQKFSRCMVMAGGGLRFGYYFGMHAAAVDAGHAPDVLLGSCGGALAASVIATTPDEQSRRAWLCSPALYHFLCQIGSTPKAKIGRVLAGLLRRYLQRQGAKTVPDLFDDYYFSLPQMPPFPVADNRGAVAVAILGARMLFDQREVGALRRGRPLFREMLFCDEQTAGLLTGFSYGDYASAGRGNVVTSELETNTTMDLAAAVRISIADPFYFQCHVLPEGNFTGGLINLFPLKIAQQLAEKVVMEKKPPFNRFYAEPAVRAVFGTVLNSGGDTAHEKSVPLWIDTRDAAQVLKNDCVKKGLDWRNGRLCLQPPASYADFVVAMEAQWNYGYCCGQRAFTNA